MIKQSDILNNDHTRERSWSFQGGNFLSEVCTWRCFNLRLNSVLEKKKYKDGKTVSGQLKHVLKFPQ